MAEYEPNVFDNLLAQSLQLLENCLDIANIGEKDEYKLSAELFKLICPAIVVSKAQSLLQLSAPNGLVSLIQDEASVQLIVNTFNLKSIRCAANKSSFTDPELFADQLYDLETLEKTLIVCKYLVQQQRAHNLVKFISEKFDSNGTGHFISVLNGLFWRIVNRTILLKDKCLAPIGQPLITDELPLVVDSLVEVMFSWLLVEMSTDPSIPSLGSIVDSLMRLLCSNILEINFTARKTLLSLLKPPKKSSSVNATATPASRSSTTPGNKPKETLATPVGSMPPPPPPPSSQRNQQPRPRVDESVRFPSLNLLNENSIDLDEASNYEEEDEQAPLASNNNAELNDLQFLTIAPYVFNEEDEMLQFAMALSLNDQQASEVALQPPPPAPLPRGSLATSHPTPQQTNEPQSNTKPVAKKTKKEDEDGEETGLL